MNQENFQKRLNNPNLGKQGRHFSSTYQPTRYRSSEKPFKNLLLEALENKKEIIIEGEDINTGKTVKIRIHTPTMEILITKLINAALKGNLKAIDMIFDRIEGKAKYKVDMEETATKKVNSYIVFSDGRKELLL